MSIFTGDPIPPWMIAAGALVAILLGAVNASSEKSELFVPLYTDQMDVCIRDLHIQIIVIHYPTSRTLKYQVLFPSGALVLLNEIELTECIPTEELVP